jgi:predicted hotdog family 3-hydroxylacyl-ACP dehydratase
MKNGTEADIAKSEIRQLIPHSGSMCLLDRVLDWNNNSITCLSRTHVDRTNPLRRGDGLSAVHAFEYGAQAMAIHGGLRARAAAAVAPPGYFAALRNAAISVPRLDNLPFPLEVRAQLLFGDSANSVYNCHLSSSDISVATGRITIILRRPPVSSRKAKAGEDSKNGNPVLAFSQSEFQIEGRISPAHPSLPGHFPGEPIVPGVLILDEVVFALRQWRRHEITRIHLAKFLSPLMPAQAFAIALATSQTARDQIIFQCCAANRLVAEGRLEVKSNE